jgi:hypothetical protein
MDTSYFSDDYSKKVALYAADMALIFLRHYNEDVNKVTDAGLKELMHLFGTVPENFRADVFLQFKQFLNDSGVKYSNEDFKV